MIRYKPTYKLISMLLFLTMCNFTGFSSDLSDIYFIFYATKDGNTGHTALAVDNYDIYVYDRPINDHIEYEYDTVKKGTLTYFDLWPEKDHFSVRNVGKDFEPKYNRLPAASFERKITLEYIHYNGIPHIKHYPCDGILEFKTTAMEDYKLMQFMDSIIQVKKPFNARSNNCSDFVLAGANYVTKKNIHANEFLPFSFSTTPNKLYKKLRKLPGMMVIKDPGRKVKGSFFKERILKILISKKYKQNSAN